MNVNSATSADAYQAQVQAPQKKPETTQAQQVAQSNRSEQGERNKQAASSEAPPAPSVNSNGQTVGRVINVKA